MTYRVTGNQKEIFTDDYEEAVKKASELACLSQAWGKVERWREGQMKNHPCQQVYIATYYGGCFDSSESTLDIKNPVRP